MITDKKPYQNDTKEPASIAKILQIAPSTKWYSLSDISGKLVAKSKHKFNSSPLNSDSTSG